MSALDMPVPPLRGVQPWQGAEHPHKLLGRVQVILAERRIPAHRLFQVLASHAVLPIQSLD
jgi:hypothetical protein